LFNAGDQEQHQQPVMTCPVKSNDTSKRCLERLAELERRDREKRQVIERQAEEIKRQGEEVEKLKADIGDSRRPQAISGTT
jgi:hypothetical protein